MEETKIVIVSEESSYTELYRSMFSDAIQSGAVFLDHVFTDKKNKIRGLLFANKLNPFFKNILPRIYLKKTELYKTLNCSKKSIVIFLSPSLQKYYTKELLRLLKILGEDTVFVLLFVDICSALQARNAFNIVESDNIFDLIYTFDINDSKKYGFIKVDTPYSAYEGEKIETEYDLYFCGAVKGRGEILNKIAKKLSALNCKWDIFVDPSKQSDVDLVEEFTTCKSRTEKMIYTEVLKKTLASNCILDIVQSGQEGYTVRYYEAICNNKKLLTNNQNVIHSPYYSSGFIRYFSNVNDIDVEWISKVEDVNYNYCNEFSPKRFIDLVKHDSGNIKNGVM